ncbi:DNA polymerase III subunit delta' [Campylobacter sp. MIT 97-5078]|uniref:DNA polymerase III subunit delta' n=1 Tax=Campylobacter sp. MIT 97-5078 TaxID=1548153 RepID=UPI00051367BD|nr:DNA polymerase III subunit delta' [Campylobacter sp. MIT 97-5078]KGI57064.1 DNA polymerase III subunit delta' [Campylobacter sp. MIT 97-5078]TQR28108.1 DNA polymerase III subunit delta' [Campylobacter sp. MIT 97-5078]
MSFVSKILISDDFEGLKEKFIKEFGEKKLRFIPKMPANELLMEDARAIEKESYIAENTEKIIIIMAKAFRIEAQNFLLKLLEEPPRNIKFLIISPSKNLLLPTIRSRLICENLKPKKVRKVLELNFENLDLKEILAFLQKNESLDKGELMELIAQLGLEASKNKNLSEEELEFFYEAYELAKLNSKPSILLSSLLLTLYKAK